MEGLKISTRNVSQNSRSADRDSNPGTTEYEAVVLDVQ
jgi:hypothetical protein